MLLGHCEETFEGSDIFWPLEVKSFLLNINELPADGEIFPFFLSSSKPNADDL